jgi:hypothetical protein
VNRSPLDIARGRAAQQRAVDEAARFTTMIAFPSIFSRVFNSRHDPCNAVIVINEEQQRSS